VSDAANRPELAAIAARPISTLAATRPVKRSFAIRGHKTSISLEHAFWEALREIAQVRSQPLAQVVASVDEARGDAGLSGAVRVFILDYYRTTKTTS
jgi:predicted DNA-binding ribbon-helix-helix protein